MRVEKFNHITSAIELHDRTKALVPYLTGWKYDPGFMDEGEGGSYILRSYSHLIHEDGRELSLHFDDVYNPKRIVIAGDMPRDREGRCHYWSSYEPERNLTRRITVAIDKPRAAIAQSIIRRLLPDHQAAHNKAKEKIADNNTFADDKYQAIEAIAALVGEELREEWKRGDASPTLGKYSGVQCRVHSATSFDITVSVASLKKAMHMISSVQSIGGFRGE